MIVRNRPRKPISLILFLETIKSFEYHLDGKDLYDVTPTSMAVTETINDCGGGVGQ